MFIRNLTLQNFKNHPFQEFYFSSQINCFVGNNGVGKTNILDALFYLSVGKSFLNSTDIQNITNDKDFFTIEATIANNDKDDILKIIQNKESRKSIKKNGKVYSKIAEHIGYLPSVMISPYDQNLISDTSESRRKFLNAMISQTDSEYLFHLMQYQKTLQQRNALLKSFQKNRYFDAESLEIYNEPLINFGQKVFEKRTIFIQEILPILQDFYQIISNRKEEISIGYKSDLETDFGQLLHENKERDKALTYTSKGIHKDDLIFEMNGDSIKKIGSQGQQKSFLIALKLAQMNLIKKLTNKTPILLLDDIFDKLDDLRVAQLIELVKQEHFGQIFITDTQKERTENIIKNITEENRIFELK